MRNYFNVVRSIGLIFFGIGTFLVGVTLPEFMERLGRGSGARFFSNNVMEDGLAAFMVLGFGFLIMGVAGLLKTRWFSKGSILVLVLAFLGFNWFAFTVMIPESRGDELLYALGVMLMAYIIIASFLLMMNNHYFLEALHVEDDKEEKDDQILDSWE